MEAASMAFTDVIAYGKRTYTYKTTRVGGEPTGAQVEDTYMWSGSNCFGTIRVAICIENLIIYRPWLCERCGVIDIKVCAIGSP